MSKEQKWYIEDQGVVELLLKNGFTCHHEEHEKCKEFLPMISFHVRSEEETQKQKGYDNWLVTNCPIEWGCKYTLPDGNCIQSKGTQLSLVKENKPKEEEQMARYSFQYVKEYYQMPFLKRGIRVHMNKRWGTVTSGDGKYIRVRFDWKSYTRNIHATWDCTYFDKDGKILANYKEGKEPPAFVPFEQEAEPHD